MGKLNEEKKAMLAATLAYTIFGLSYLFSKMALNVTDPTILLWIRFTVTFICLNILVLTGVAKVNYRGKHIWQAILLGILQPGLYFVLENYGIMYTTTSFTGLMSSVSPIFTAILGALILREKPNMKQWVCIVISIIGVMIVSVGGTGGQNTVAGCICLLAAYFLGSFYSLLARHISKEFTPFEMTYMMFTVGFVFFTAWAFLMNGAEAIPMVSYALGHTDVIIAALYLGIFSSVCAYFLANYSLARLPVARSTIFGNMATIVSVLAGVIFMGDTFTWLHALSFVLILAGVFGVNRFAAGEK